MISLSKHKNVIQELGEQWVEEIFFQKIQWEEMRDKLKELNNYQSMEKNKEQMLNLTHELLSYGGPSLSYPVFLFKQMILFQIKALKKGRHWKIVTPSQFLETFTQSEFFEQNLLCELYLHARARMMDT